MSGSVLGSFLASTAYRDTGSSLLAALYNSSPQTSADPIAALNAAVSHQAADVATEGRLPSVQRDIAAFTAAISSAKSADALLSSPAFLKVLLTANGLGDQAAYPALAKQALLSDTTQSNSLASRLANTSWKSTAATYQFGTAGLSVIQQPAVQQKLVDAYSEVLWRQSLDVATPGLSNALSFRASASGITSVDQILGDPILRDVVTTALGIPREIAVQPLEAQERAISSRLDLSTFQTPAGVERFTQRYLVAKGQQPSTATATTPTLDGLAAQASGLLV